MTTRLKKQYDDVVRAKLKAEFNYANDMEVPRIEKDARLQILRRPKGVSYIFLEFNTKKPPFDKLALRRAIAYSVDSKEVLDASYLYGTVIQAPLPLGVPGFSGRSGSSTGTSATTRRPRPSSRRRASQRAPTGSCATRAARRSRSR